MQTEGVKEGRETFHHYQNGYGEKGPKGENYIDGDWSRNVTLDRQALFQDHVP